MTALIITFILLLVVGAPIFFAVGISASAFVLSSGSNSLAIITQKMVDGIISTTLMALPLFIYSGNLMSCGATQRLMRFADMILGKIPGGLGTAVMECVNKNGLQSIVHRVGIPDKFVKQGTVTQLYKQCGMDSESIKELIISLAGDSKK